MDATEGEIVELFPAKGPGRATSPPHLLYTIRNTSCTRAVSHSSDAGLSWTSATRAPTPMNEDPGCKGGITRWEAGRALIFANAGTCAAARIDTTVRISLDNGVTWPHAQLIDKDSGYTTPQMLEDEDGGSMIGVVYEKQPPFVDGCSIHFATVDAREILAGGKP